MKTLVVAIGRFAPGHRQHVEDVVGPAMEAGDAVLVLLGSSCHTLDHKNPFKWEDRAQMLRLATEEWIKYPETFKIPVVRKLGTTKLAFAPLKDYDNDNAWILQVQKTVDDHLKTLDGKHQIVIMGNDKDETSRYLKWFPQWRARIGKVTKPMNATDVRAALFEGRLDTLSPILFPSTIEYLRTWLTTDIGKWIQAEYEWHQGYKMLLCKKIQNPIVEDREKYPWIYVEMPYAPIYHTVDNVVLWRGHVLLIRRKHRPGLGLHALPGGFLNPDERILAGALREGEEEARIRVYLPGTRTPVRLSRSWCTLHKTFDDPRRSLRGRIITDAYLWQIPDEMEVEVEAGDDAAPRSAKFYSLHTILNGPMDYMLFEDHQSIIRSMVLER